MKAKNFRELRRLVIAEGLRKYALRMKKAEFIPTEEELVLGTFLEDIELQAREAVQEMNRKGYCTWSSGFYGRKSEWQGIDGPFVLDKETIKKLRAMGAVVRVKKFWRVNYTDILFKPKTPDTQAIGRMWAKIMAIIPKKKKLAPLAMTYGAVQFRAFFSKDLNQPEILRLERLILNMPGSRWAPRWRRKLNRLRKTKPCLNSGVVEW